MSMYLPMYMSDALIFFHGFVIFNETKLLYVCLEYQNNKILILIKIELYFSK